MCVCVCVCVEGVSLSAFSTSVCLSVSLSRFSTYSRSLSLSPTLTHTHTQGTLWQPWGLQKPIRRQFSLWSRRRRGLPSARWLRWIQTHVPSLWLPDVWRASSPASQRELWLRATSSWPLPLRRGAVSLWLSTTSSLEGLLRTILAVEESITLTFDGHNLFHVVLECLYTSAIV